MAPAFSHPPGVTFIDENHNSPLVSEPSVYYGAAEAFSRSRTYSAVSFAVLPLFPDRPALMSDLTLIRTIFVIADFFSWVHTSARPRVWRRSSQSDQANVP